MIASSTRSFSSHRRVVVTGIGAITPMGNSFQSTWDNLVSPISLSPPDNNYNTNNNTINDIGITTLEEAMLIQQLPSQILDHEMALAMKSPSQVAAPVRGVAYCPRTTRFVQLALIAAKESITHAGLDTWLGRPLDDTDDARTTTDTSTSTSNSNSNSNTTSTTEEELQHRLTRIGTCIGSGMSSVREVVAAYEAVSTKQSLRRLSPHFVPKVLTNSASARISLEYQLQGPNLAPSTACAAGAHAIGEAMRCIQYNDADIMLAGGSEACIDPISMGGFSRLKALSTNFNDDPLSSSRPFDTRRDGFVMGEGSCILILEELDHALRRKADILCEIRGYGITGDGYHVTSPHPNGIGAERAMRIALDRAGLEPSCVDYVNAHATSTPMGDSIEEQTIARVVAGNDNDTTRTHPTREKDVYVSSTKGAMGHLLGAAGAIEAAIAIMTIKDGIVPPTKNLDDVGFQGFHHVIGNPIKDDIHVSVSNSFGFGGTNASIVFSSLDETATTATATTF